MSDDSARRAEIRQAKRELRRRVLAARDALSPEHRARASTAICRTLPTLDAYARAHRIALFAAFRSEVNLDAAILSALADGKEVYLPATDLAAHVLTFHRVTSLSELREGAFGIREPLHEGRAPLPLAELDLVVTPGAAFDPTGARIGYGGGFYDAVLAGLRRDALAVGVCFEVQVVDRVPTQPHDRRVGLLVTERRVMKTA